MRGPRRGPGVWGALAVAASLVTSGWVAAPAQADEPPPAAVAAVTAGVVRDALVFDQLTDSDTYGPRASTGAWDSATRTGPTVTASPYAGGVRVIPGSSAGVEIIPPDSGRLAVGTYTKVPGLVPSGARTTPVVRLSKAITSCSSFGSIQGGTLTVDAVSYATDGSLASLAATFLMPCYPSSTGSSVAGVVRVRSSADYTAVSSVSTTLPSVVSGSRTPYDATLRNLGAVPITLGQAAALPVAADEPRVEPVAGADGCSGTTLAAGASCGIRVEYVDDGIPGGGYPAWLAIPAPGTVRGTVRIGLTVQSVIQTPGAPQSLTTDAGYDGVSIRWTHDSSAPLPDGFRIRRVDGPDPVLLATQALDQTTFVDTTLGKGESGTYVVSAYTAAGEASADPVTITRPDLPDPPDADAEQALVVESASASSVLRDGTAAPLGSSRPVLRDRVSELSGSNTILGLPRFPGPGTYDVGGTSPYQVSLMSVASTCSVLRGTAVVREAWVRADGTVHRMDADLHLDCVGTPVEIQVRYGVARAFSALTSTPGALGGPSFTDVVVGQTSTPQTLTLTNAGTATVALSPASTTGTDRSAFEVAATTCGASLAPAASCTVDVAFAPTRTGYAAATLVVPSDTPVGAHTTALAGTATGAPGSWAPMAVAVLGRTALSWYAGADGGSPVTSIGVERATDDGPFERLADVAATDYSYLDTTAAPGVAYRYRLVATNQYGSTPTSDADVVAVVGADEELLLSSGSATADLVSGRLGDGRAVALGTGQDTDTPAVSPDGRSVAYMVYDASYASGLWVRSLTPGGPAPRLLVDDPTADEQDPTWAPDGSRVCYTRVVTSTGVAALWCIGTAPGAVAAPLPGGQQASSATFLPDGSGLVAADETQDRLLRISAAGARTAVPGSEGAYLPVVSPRGDLIAFTAFSAAGEDQLVTLPIAGGRVTVRAAAGSDGLFGRPAWAPGGAALAVPRWGSLGDTVTVWRADPDGGTGTTSSISPAGGDPVYAAAWRRADHDAPTVEFPKAPARTSGSAVLPVRVLDDTVPVGGLTVACTVDGTSVPRCDTGFRGTLGSGTHTLRVTASDPFGHSSSASHTWTVDAVAPVLSVPALPAAVLGTSVTFGYAATDASGIGGYDVRVRSASWARSGFSAFSQPAAWTGTTARSVTVGVSAGYEYCFSVRAKDALGTWSAWSAERCTSRPLDDRSMVAGSGWSRLASSSAYAGTLSRSTTAGTSLTRSGSYVRRVVVVATTCPTCGSLDVYVGSTRIGTVSLYSSTTRTKQLLSVSATSLRSGTITLRARTTGRPVIVDGLGIRKT